MNLIPFILIKKALSDLKVIHDFNYITPPKTIEEFLEEGCDNHSTQSTCMIHEG